MQILPPVSTVEEASVNLTKTTKNFLKGTVKCLHKWVLVAVSRC